MKPSVILAATLLWLVSVPAVRADDAALASSLEKVSKDQIAAFNQEDVAATMGYADTKSPTYETTKKVLTEYFKNQKLKAEQVSFQYIGHDDEFAYARVKVKVTSPGTKDFQDNVADTVTLFHQEGGTWKLWDAYLVGGELVK
jgi:hypothetical protein